MASLGIFVALGALAACGGGSAGELVPGGSVAGPPLAGTLHVFVVDEVDGTKIAGARVWVGASAAPDAEGTSDANGLATLASPSLTGAISVSASATGSVSTTFAGVANESVTVPLPRVGGVQAGTVMGTIAGFDDVAPMPGHHRLAVVDVTRSAESVAFAAPVLVDEALPHVCVRRAAPSSCAFVLSVAPGAHTPFATIVDVDEGLTASTDDDVLEVVGFVRGASIDVAAGATVGDALLDTSIDAVALTVDVRGLPPGLVSVVGVPGLRGGPDEEVMLVPVGATTATGTTWVPVLSGDLAGGSYWVIARATSADGMSSSLRVGRGVTDVAAPVTLDGWAVPPGVALETDALAVALTSGAAHHEARFLATGGAYAWQVILLGAANGIALDVAEDASALAGASVDVTALVAGDALGTSVRDVRDGVTGVARASIVLP